MPVAQKANAVSLLNICGVTHKYQFIIINRFLGRSTACCAARIQIMLQTPFRLEWDLHTRVWFSAICRMLSGVFTVPVFTIQAGFWESLMCVDILKPSPTRFCVLFHLCMAGRTEEHLQHVYCLYWLQVCWVLIPASLHSCMQSRESCPCSSSRVRHSSHHGIRCSALVIRTWDCIYVLLIDVLPSCWIM